MPVPIAARNPLRMNQGVFAVGGRGETPFDPQISLEPYQKHPFAFLWDAVVGGVHQRGQHVIGEPRCVQRAGGLFALEPVIVRVPRLISPGCHFRELKLKQDVLKIVGKAGAGQAFDVFQNECLWPERFDDLDGVREHVAHIVMGAVLAAH